LFGPGIEEQAVVELFFLFKFVLKTENQKIKVLSSGKSKQRQFSGCRPGENGEAEA
jgi:hypothetical protein